MRSNKCAHVPFRRTARQLRAGGGGEVTLECVSADLGEVVEVLIVVASNSLTAQKVV